MRLRSLPPLRNVSCEFQVELQELSELHENYFKNYTETKNVEELSTTMKTKECQGRSPAGHSG